METKITDNDIIKALECCQYESVETCRDCPMFYTHEFDNEIDFDCGKYIYGRAIKIINHQKEEIEQLKKIISHKNSTKLDVLENEINRQKAEVEKLSNCVVMQEKLLRENEKWMESVVKNIIAYEKLKAEAIKEFAERLKNEFEISSAYSSAYIECKIDNLVKEMVGDTK